MLVYEQLFQYQPLLDINCEAVITGHFYNVV